MKAVLSILALLVAQTGLPLCTIAGSTPDRGDGTACGCCTVKDDCRCGCPDGGEPGESGRRPIQGAGDAVTEFLAGVVAQSQVESDREVALPGGGPTVAICACNRLPASVPASPEVRVQQPRVVHVRPLAALTAVADHIPVDPHPGQAQGPPPDLPAIRTFVQQI